MQVILTEQEQKKLVSDLGYVEEVFVKVFPELQNHFRKLTPGLYSLYKNINTGEAPPALKTPPPPHNIYKL